MSRIVIIGAGPAGYEAALVAAHYSLGAEVAVIDAEGAGGACVLHDCVPSKTFIASSDAVTGYRGTERFGIHPAQFCRRGGGRGGGARPRTAVGRSPVSGHPPQAGQGRGAGDPRLGPAGHPVCPASACGGGGDSRRSGAGDRRRRGADRHGRDAPGAADRRAGRGTDPDLAAGLRPARTARAPDRGRLRRHRRRVRLRLHRDGRPGDPGLQSGPGAAARGRRRRRGDRAGVPRAGDDVAQQVPGGIGRPGGRRGGGRPSPTAGRSPAPTR